MILADPYPSAASYCTVSISAFCSFWRVSSKVAAIIACQSNRVPFCGIEYIRVLFSETRDKPKLSFGSGPLAGEHRIEKGLVSEKSREKIRLVLSLIRLGQIKVSKWERVQVSPIIT